MAVIYLRSTDGNDGDSGATWALAKATLAAALTAAGAGGTVYVSQSHAETQASAMTLTSPGAVTTPVTVLCVNDGAEPPTALATTATVSTTGASAIGGFGGYAYVYGIAFQSGDAGNAANINLTANASKGWTLDTCTLKLNNTSTSSRIAFGVANTTMIQFFLLHNTILNFGSSSQGITPVMGIFRWTGATSAVAGTAPATLFLGSVAVPFRASIYGVDLSGLGSGNLVSVANFTQSVDYEFTNCKLGSTNYATGTIQRGTTVRIVNCDNADTNYNFYYQDYAGNVQDEITIVRTGGASDGLTPLSYKFSSSAQSRFYLPLYGQWIYVWNEVVGAAVTVSIEVITDNVTLTDAEAWIEVEHLGTSGFPLSLVETDQVTDPIFGTPAAQTTSTVGWTTTGLTTPVKQVLSKAVTPQERGWLRARAVLAKTSTVMYADQRILA